MKAELKEKWVSALRSGKYRQGKAALRGCAGIGLSDDDSFCCLGVLVDVVSPEKWQVQPSGFGAIPMESPKDEYGHFDGIAYPTVSFLESVGLEKSVADTLAMLNDDKYEDFDQIADYIESEL
jgi:hypothetical protein